MPLPEVFEAFWDIQDTVAFRIVGKAVSDFQVREFQNEPVYFQGVIETIDPTKLEIKPEGQRKWNQFYLWTREELELDYIIEDMEGKRFRLLSKSDWGTHFQYEVKENPLS